MESKDNSKTNWSSTKHEHTYDTNRINKAVEKASRDANFLSHAASLLAEMQFPTYKNNILEYVNKVTTDTKIILFKNLDGYIRFKDLYHVKKALEENNPEKKQTYQLSDETRESPNVRTQDVTIDISTREGESVNMKEERKDYPEVTPGAISNFICNTCAKPFQNQNDLVIHQHFERGEETRDKRGRT